MLERVPALWVPRVAGAVTRYHRDAQGAGGRYNLRHIMEPTSGAKPQRRKWALFYKDDRVWDVQPQELLSAAIEAAEEWISKG